MSVTDRSFDPPTKYSHGDTYYRFSDLYNLRNRQTVLAVGSDL